MLCEYKGRIIWIWWVGKNGINWVSREKKGRFEKNWRCKLNVVKFIVGYFLKNILYRF